MRLRHSASKVICPHSVDFELTISSANKVELSKQDATIRMSHQNVYRRLPWPEGTVIYEAASKEAHLFAHGKLKAAGARVPRGSLLRRVTYEIKVG